MKKILIILSLILLPAFSQAKDLSKVRIVYTDFDVCGETYQECYIVGTDYIFIRKKINWLIYHTYPFKYFVAPTEWMSFVEKHGFCHWLVNGQDISLFNNDDEKAADNCAYVILGKEKNLKYFNYWLSLLKK